MNFECVMTTLKEQFRRLSSDDPSARGVAALVLNRSGIAIYKDAVRQMVLKEKHHLPLMTVSHLVVEWNDETLEKLLLINQDERVLFTLLEAARLQKRRVSEESILRLLAHRSIFVRLAALKQAIVANLAIDLVSVLIQLETDAYNHEFVEIPNMPSAVFRRKTEFLRLLSRMQWIILHQKKHSV